MLRNVKWKTGMIVLMHTNPWINSFGDGPWSHVAMVIMVDEVPHLFEITGSGECKATLKPLMPEFRRVLSVGNNVVAFRKIHGLTKDVRKKLSEFAHAVVSNGRKYSHIYWREVFQRLLGWAFPLDTPDIASRGSDCSSIIAETLHKNGVLKRSVRAFEILPSDYSKGAMRLPLRGPNMRWGTMNFVRTSQVKQKEKKT